MAFFTSFFLCCVVSTMTSVTASEVVDYCPTSQFLCENNRCIPLVWRCDGTSECGDDSDEKHCADKVCEQNEFRCGGGKCIPNRWLCDGDSDCEDHSDEAPSICVNRTCAEHQFTCAGGMCISQEWHCDFHNDCPLGDDEVDCEREPCEDDEFRCNNGRCISSSWVCDIEDDCGDRSDELQCEEVKCKEGDFMCHNNQCIMGAWHCDGDMDCIDHSDEIDCPFNETNLTPCSPREFACDSHDCIRKSWFCDGDVDCADGSDEKNCTDVLACAAEQFLCDDHKYCISASLVCNGFADCKDKSDEHQCEDAHMICEATSEFDCDGDGRFCVPLDAVCNGVKDCLNGADEAWGVGQLCAVENPCNRTDNGNCTHKCHFLGKEHRCDCFHGYRLAADNRTCEDIDECAQAGSCSQLCLNTPGSFKCSCMEGYEREPNEPSVCRAVEGDGTLLFANKFDLRELILKTREYRPVINMARNLIAFDYDYDEKVIYWSDIGLHIINSTRMQPKSSSSDGLFISKSVHTPDGLAFDWIHKNLYWTDAGKKVIGVAQASKGTPLTLISGDLKEPRGIAVDPREGQGWIYWTDWGDRPRIEKAGLDGSDRHEIVNTGIEWPNGLALDLTTNRIYWVDAKLHAIISCNFNGGQRVQVYTSNGFLAQPFAITVFEQWLYWTDWDTKSIFRLNKFGHGNVTGVVQQLHTPMDIHMFHAMAQPSGKSFCGQNNGGCSHLCLPLPHKPSVTVALSYRCACPDGATLNADKRTCDIVPSPPGMAPGVKPEVATGQQGVTNGGVQYSQHTLLIIIVLVFVCLVIIMSLMAFMVYRLRELKKRVKRLDFQNPVYRRTTEELAFVEPVEAKPAIYPSTLEPLTLNYQE